MMVVALCISFVPCSAFEQSLAQVSPCFIENRGQIINTKGNLVPEVQYYSKNSGQAEVYLTPTRISYVLPKTEKVPLSDKRVSSNTALLAQHTLWNTDSLVEVTSLWRTDVVLVGANPNAIIEPTEQVSEYFNFYYGHCPDGITNVHGYQKLIVRDVYPHIDLVWITTKSGGLKYEFHVKPGGNPNQIHLRYDGANNLHLSDGTIEAITPHGSITDSKPETFILKNSTEFSVNSKYSVSGNDVRFTIENYDKTQTLIIDPNVIWGTFCGGSNDFIGMARNTANNEIAVLFETITNNFPANAGQTASGGGVDNAVTKLNTAGVLQWATYFGGDNNEKVINDINSGRITFDGSGDVVFCGCTSSSNFPSTINTYKSTGVNVGDWFVVKLTGATGARSWATQYGSNLIDGANNLCVDGSNNIIVVGFTVSFPTNSFSTTSAAFKAITNSGSGAIVKFNSSGTRQWATLFNDTISNTPSNPFIQGLNAVACDASGNIFVAGAETGKAYPTTAGGYQPNDPTPNTCTDGSCTDAVIASFASDGSRRWATYYDGTAINGTGETNRSFGSKAVSIVVDGNGNVWVGGNTTATDFPVTPDGYQIATNGTPDCFLLKFNNTGTRLWASYLTWPGMQRLGTIALGSNNDILVSLSTNANNFFTTTSAYQVAVPATANPLGLMRFDNNGTLLWSTYFAPNNSSATDNTNISMHAAILQAEGTLILVGSADKGTNPVVFPTGRTKINRPGGTQAGWVAKVCAAGGPSPSQGGNRAICLGDTTQLGIAPVAGMTYVWTPTTNMVNPTSAQPKVFPTTTTTYYVLATDGEVCEKYDSVVVTVNPRAIVPSKTEPDQCFNSITTYTMGSYPGHTFEWTVSGGDIQGLNTKDSVKVLWNRAGRDTLFVKVTTPLGCETFAKIFVNVNPKIVITKAADTLVCKDSLVQLYASATGGAGGLSYSWFPIGGLSNPNSPTTTFKPGTPNTTYKFEITVTDSKGCKSVDTQFINVRANPTIFVNNLPLDFGQLDGCTSSKQITSGITNTSTEDVAILSITFTDPQVSLISPALPFTIATKDVKDIVLRYTPTAPGLLNNVKMNVRGGLCGVTTSADVKGEKLKVIVSSSVGILDYGQSNTCDSAKKDTAFTINNGGTDAALLKLSSTVFAAPFSLVSPTADVTVPAGGSQQIVVRYAPTSAGIFDYDLKIPFTAGTCNSDISLKLSARRIDPKVRALSSPLSIVPLTGCESFKDTVIDLKNESTAPVQITGLLPAGVFTPQQTLPITIQPNATLSLKVRFVPPAQGAYTGTMDIKYEPCGKVEKIQVTGMKQGISFNLTDTVDIGEVVFCAANKTATKTFDITYSTNSTAPGKVVSATVFGPFTTVLKGGENLPNGVKQTFQVTFEPQITTPEGIDILGRIEVALDPCNRVDTIWLKGRKTDGQLTGGAIVDFGQVQTGTTKFQDVVFTNTGTATLKVESVLPISVPFGIVSITPPLPADIPPGGTVTVKVQYTGGTQTGISQHKFIATVTTPCPLTAERTVQAENSSVPVPSIKADNIDFLQVQRGTTKQLAVTVTNDGDTTAIISKTEWVTNQDNAYSVIGFVPFTLKPTESQKITIEFAPTLANPIGIKPAELRIIADVDSANSTITGIATDVAQPKRGIISTDIDFLNVQLTASKQLKFTITNSGDIPDTVTSFAFTQNDENAFTVDNTVLPLTIAPKGGTAQVTATFTPQTIGQKRGAVTITAKGGTSATKLQGNGVTTPPASSIVGFAVPTVEAEPGDEITFPLQIKSGVNTNDSNTRSYTASLHYEKSLLAPLDNNSCVYVGDSCQLTVSGTRQQTGNILTLLRFRALLGKVDSTVIRIASFQWNDPSVSVVAESGLYRMKGTCIGTTRHFLADGKVVAAATVRPNPASNELIVDVTMPKASYLKITLFDVVGREVGTIFSGETKSETMSFHYSLSDIQNGVYTVRISSGSEVQGVVLSVVK
jgi:hypothetical protein